MKNDYILIVDDEPQNLKVVGAILQDNGYNFSFANNGEEALKRIESRIPSLVLLDIMMPGMNGFEVCKRIKTNEKTMHVPVLMLSGLKEEEDIAQALEIGADDFLTKPIRPIEMQARVKSLLRTRELFNKLQEAHILTENLVQMVAHDLRAPLTVVKCISSILKTKSDEKIKDFGERIHLSSNRAENMINDMLSVMNYTGESFKLSLEQKVLGDFFKSVVDSLLPLVEQNRMSIVLDVDGAGDTKACFDTYLIGRCVENLVLNAIKFSKRDTQITVSLGVEDGEWIFRVIDQGQGLPPDNEDIFALHSSGDGTNHHSHGIGLSFCQLVVESHKGRIRTYNNDPNGAVFEVKLPLVF